MSACQHYRKHGLTLASVSDICRRVRVTARDDCCIVRLINSRILFSLLSRSLGVLVRLHHRCRHVTRRHLDSAIDDNCTHPRLLTVI